MRKGVPKFRMGQREVEVVGEETQQMPLGQKLDDGLVTHALVPPKGATAPVDDYSMLEVLEAALPFKFVVVSALLPGIMGAPGGNSAGLSGPALHQLIDDTAIREANEEIKIPRFRFTKAAVHRFGGCGDFECGTLIPGAENVEYSTLFVAVLPRNVVSITAQDTVGRAGVEVEVSNLRLRSVTLDDLLAEYGKTPGEFADGLGRILQQLARVPGTRQSFETFLA